jgi:NADPH:quinone reductase-like Zn-dependent oxidoreductase
MKALLSHAPGAGLSLDEVPDPVAGPGELLIAVRAVGVNYPDVLIIEDQYQFKPPRPFAPGGELAGVVEAVGSDVTGWALGDRADRRHRLGRHGGAVAWPRRAASACRRP